MPDFVYDIPPRQLALYFAIITVSAMLVGLVVIKPILRLLLGAGPDFNESVGYATSGFSLFYGLLLGLLTVAAYQNSDRVQAAILSEATAIGTLYSDMNSYPEPLRSDVREMLRDYVLFTIHKDWAAHRQGEFLDGGNNRTDAMRQILADYEPETTGQEIIHTQVMSAFQDFLHARQGRITGVFIELPDVLWYAVLVGAAINILLLTVLRMQPARQFVLGSISAFFLGVIIFVIVSLDDPLRGEAGLNPTPLQVLWDRRMSWDDTLA